MTYHDPQCTIYQGEAVEVLKTLPAESVHMILTSPPYFGLQKYKAPDVIFDNHNGCQHEFTTTTTTTKNTNGLSATTLTGGIGIHTQAGGTQSMITGQCSKCGAWRGQLGLEPTPELYIKHLCDIFDACRPVLKKTGTLWVNIDDSYAGSGKGFGGDHGKAVFTDDDITQPLKYNIPSKSLIAIPARFQIEMINRGWICRQVIIWHKGNPMPESVKDRFTNDFEYLFMFSQQERYYFEQRFEKMAFSSGSRLAQNVQSQIGSDRVPGKFNGKMKAVGKYSLGRNKRSVWKINTKGYKDAHFTTFPPALCTTPILAGCPEFICSKCGKPRVKVYEKGFTSHTGQTDSQYQTGSTANRLALLRQAARVEGHEYSNQKKEVGLSDCGCGAGFHPGTVMDIFSGSGTVAEEARKLGRKAILIDVSEEYCGMAVKRVSRLPIPQGVAL